MKITTNHNNYNQKDGEKKDLSKLKAKGVIERIGTDQGGYWKVIKK